ncbi:peroxiredoxin family protein, partial [Nevskia soli]|uniref:peroxiredoxin family protein n=1 Tax=Nevskia soli TaxID=418856 RepID=UPI0015D77ADD
MRFLACVVFGVTLGAIAIAAPVPRPAPVFAMNMTDGTKTRLQKYRGKVVLLAFIKTGCSHCQAVTGIFEALQTELGARGLQVLEAAV